MAPYPEADVVLATAQSVYPACEDATYQPTSVSERLLS